LKGKEITMDSKTVRQKHKDFLFPSVINYYSEPLVLERGQGAVVFDKDGHPYLDFFGGILTISLGHCHPAVTEQVISQLRRLQHTSTLYPNEAIVSLAETMSRITPSALRKSFFTNSGTEANETAILLARVYTSQQEIIALRHGYSGRSMLAMTLTAHSAWRALPTSIAGIKHAHSPYCYRCALGLSYPACDLRCARDLDELILTETTGRIAGFIAEPIQGVGGFIVPPKEYFQVAVEIIRRHGGVFICDEVQTGFGRTGEKMFGIEHFGVEPEIMTMAKGVANGFPMGVTITTDEIASSLKALTISTFGGNPVSCKAAQATIDVIEKEHIPKRASELGKRLRSGLEDLAKRHQVIGDVRGMGLMQALELVEDRKTKAPAPAHATQFLEKARSKGLLLGKGGLYGNVIRISPPMLVSEQEVDSALMIIELSLE
jgi:4-aminobutyrate aminotransferase-like enzyme